MNVTLRRPLHPNVYWPDQYEVVANEDTHPIVLGNVRNQGTGAPGGDNWKPYDEQGRPIGDPYRAARAAAVQMVVDRWMRDH